MELWDLYTVDRKPLGKTMVRGEPNPDGCYNLGVYIWIRNREGKYLISQRAADKSSYPLCWETVGGCVLAGETSLQGAVREVREEVGLVIAPDQLELIFTLTDSLWHGHVLQEIDDVYLCRLETEYDESLVVSDEVIQGKWMTTAEIRQLFRKNRFIDVLEPIFDKIDNVR